MTCSTSPGSSFSQIKATRPGSFFMCTSTQFSVEKVMFGKTLGQRQRWRTGEWCSSLTPSSLNPFSTSHFSLPSPTYSFCLPKHVITTNKGLDPIYSSIWQYLTVFNSIAIYPRTTIWKHSDQILNTGKYPQHHQILGIVNRTCFYSQYREIPLATVGNHMGTHQILLESFSNLKYSNYPTCTVVWQTWQVRAIEIWIYQQLLSHTQVFDGIWVDNIRSNNVKYHMGTSLNFLA